MNKKIVAPENVEYSGNIKFKIMPIILMKSPIFLFKKWPFFSCLKKQFLAKRALKLVTFLPENVYFGLKMP
jgi:hypothetical protein